MYRYFYFWILKYRIFKFESFWSGILHKDLNNMIPSRFAFIFLRLENHVNVKLFLILVILQYLRKNSPQNLFLQKLPLYI